nr:diguanylate cyclase [Salinivibrio sp. ES.052]
MICFGVLIATFLLYKTAQTQQTQRIDQLLDVEVQSFSGAISLEVNEHLNRLSRLASDIEKNVPSTFSTWHALAQQALGENSYFTSLFWADHQQKISWQTTQQRDSAKPTFSFNIIGEQDPQLNATPPERMSQWHIAYPIYTHNRTAPSHFLGATINLEALIRKVENKYLDEYQHLTITTLDGDRVLFGNNINRFAASSKIQLALIGVQPSMTLTLWQEPGANQFISLPILIYIAGMIVAFLLGIALYLAEVNLMSRRAAQTTIDYLKNEMEQRKDVEHQLHFVANHDPLTYLPNRHALTDHIQNRLYESISHRLDLALICIDVDNIKEINDLYGHSVHDALMVELTHRLQRLRYSDNYLAKISDDQFAIVGTDLPPLKAEVYAKHIRHALEQPFIQEGKEIIATCAIGISYRYDASMPAQELLRHADTAAHRARQLNHHRVVVFQMAMRDHLHQKKDTEYAIRKAIQGHELSLHFQPQIDLETHNIAGIEALVRWQDTAGAVISPDTIIRTAEDTGLIRQLGAWVVDKALESYATLLVEECAPPAIAINISGHEFQDKILADTILQAIKRHHIPPNAFKLS